MRPSGLKVMNKEDMSDTDHSTNLSSLPKLYVTFETEGNLPNGGTSVAAE
jgi:hypothetical protein